jgi:hypothetical protein
MLLALKVAVRKRRAMTTEVEIERGRRIIGTNLVAPTKKRHRPKKGGAASDDKLNSRFGSIRERRLEPTFF